MYISLLLISFHSNGWNISHWHAIRYGNTTHSTLGRISDSFGKFQPLCQILVEVYISLDQILNFKKKKLQTQVATMPLVAILLLFSISSSLLHFFFFFFASHQSFPLLIYVSTVFQSLVLFFRICLKSTYFTEIENFLLKVL